MCDDLDNLFNKKEEYLKSWLNNFENIQDNVKYVRQAYLFAEWEKDVFIERPQNIPKYKDYILPLIFIKRLSDVFEDELEKEAKDFGGSETA